MSEKEKLLKHYLGREPQTFFKFEGFPRGNCVGSLGCFSDVLERSITRELMDGYAQVQLFIPDGTSKGGVLRLLRAITKLVENHDDEVFVAPRKTESETFFVTGDGRIVSYDGHESQSTTEASGQPAALTT